MDGKIIAIGVFAVCFLIFLVMGAVFLVIGSYIDRETTTTTWQMVPVSTIPETEPEPDTSVGSKEIQTTTTSTTTPTTMSTVDANICSNKLNGWYCNGYLLVRCENGVVVKSKDCRQIRSIRWFVDEKGKMSNEHVVYEGTCHSYIEGQADCYALDII